MNQGARSWEQQQPYRGMLAIQVAVPERLAFLKKVYSLFSLAILVFTGAAWMGTAVEPVRNAVLSLYGGAGILGFLVIMAGMFLVMRLTAARFPINIVALGGFAVIEGLLTAPLIFMILKIHPETGAGIVAQAAVLTAVVFGSLTLFTLTSKRDFSWMRAGLWAGFGILFGFMILGMLFGWSTTGWGVSLAWVLLMAGFLIYDTSNVMRRFPTTMAATAAATIFLDVVILFQQLLMLLGRRD